MLNRLKPSTGTKKKRKRVGRGVGSGHGKTSCRGSKGLFARSGGKLRHSFEGGQMPLIRRISKRGFTGKKNIYQIVNLDGLDKIKIKGAISPIEMRSSGLIKNAWRPVKVLARGRLSRPVTVTAHAFSGKAKAGIEASGGKAEIIKI